MRTPERFQEALNRALVRYLHGVPLSRVLFPFAGAPGPDAARDLAAVRDAARELGLDLPHARPAAFLAAAFRALDGLVRSAGSARGIGVAPWDAARHGRVPALAEARARLLHHARRAGVTFLLHGSYSTLDYTAYSDLDTLLLVPKDVATSADALGRCRSEVVATLRHVKAFDPLQHHGHFVLTEIDLDGYPDPLFPAVVLERCTALEPRPLTLAVKSVPAPAMARRRFRAAAERFLQTDLRRGLDNAYRLKSDLSVFMLLPALWWQARGRAVAKRESFQALFPLVSPAAAEAYRRAADLRRLWEYREPPLHRLARRVWGNPFLPAALGAARARRPVRAVETLARAGFFDLAKGAVAELLRMDEEHAGQRSGARDALA